ncbi:MAG: aminopeptidase P family protein [Muribaculaceae bacterium]|nr:aminopeptidase P family protein [Muribaculaceae bacterium]
MKTIFKERINALRANMQANGIAVAIIPQSDPHQSEYIANHWQVRRWLSGFTGSAGTLVVTLDKALLWTDSRYFIQAADQLNGTDIILMKDGLIETPSISQYIIDNTPAGATIGIDGMVYSASEAESMKATFAAHNLKIDDTFNPNPQLWSDRPALPECKIIIHEEKYAGESASSKIEKVLSNVTAQGAYSTFVSALDEIAWVLNIRSRDVKCNPVATSFLYLSPKGSTLFINEAKLTDETKQHLANSNVATAPYESIKDFLTNLPDSEKVLIDIPHTATAILPMVGSRIVKGQSPIILLKSIKNEIQIEGTRKAMIRDGVALVKLFMDIENRLNNGNTITEVEVGNLAAHYRAEGELYFDESFDPIAGFGAHGAIVHYSATEDSDVALSPDNMFLLDSGGQYFDGTTDITRTVSLGNTTAQQKRDFTLVMKGHIAVGSMIFPAGTRGAQLDALARQFLWKDGLSYLHGTGHGVGHFLNVHEGPQNIRLNENPATLVPGMITSNEPGVYREGEYGIRCENLVLTVPAFSTEFGEFYKFETLTLFPFDLNLFDTSIMSDEEIAWINDYHTMVRERLTPYLNTEQAAWLADKTRELTR